MAEFDDEARDASVGSVARRSFCRSERARVAGDAQELVVGRALSNRDLLGLARGGLLLLRLRGHLRRLRELGRGRGGVLVAPARGSLGVGGGRALARRRLAARSGSGGGVLGRVGPFDAGILGVVGRVLRGGRGRRGAARGLDVLDIEVLRDRAKSGEGRGEHRQRRARRERVVSDARNRNLARKCGKKTGGFLLTDAARTLLAGARRSRRPAAEAMPTGRLARAEAVLSSMSAILLSRRVRTREAEVTLRYDRKTASVKHTELT